MRPKWIAGLTCLVAGVLVFGARPALADTVTWDNGSSDGKWSTPANWSPDGVPVPGDHVVLASSCTSTCTADSVSNNLGGITLDTGYTGTVTFLTNAVAGGMSLNVTGDITVLSGNLVLMGNTSADSIPGGANDGTGYTIGAANITIAAGGSINADGKGFQKLQGPGCGMRAGAGAGVTYSTYS